MRLDKWLWAARLYNTRALAAEAVAGGKVQVNGERVKPAKAVRIGDAIRVRKPPYEYCLTVRAVSQRRSRAAEALKLYEETPDGRRAREMLALQVALMPSSKYTRPGRPSKKDRRAISRLKREGGDR